MGAAAGASICSNRFVGVAVSSVASRFGCGIVGVSVVVMVASALFGSGIVGLNDEGRQGCVVASALRCGSGSVRFEVVVVGVD